MSRYLYSDFTDFEKRIVSLVHPAYTMTSPERVVSLIRAVQHVIRWKIPGDIVECGVWRGGSMLAVAETLADSGDIGRTLWMYDTFKGMPPPQEVDRDSTGTPAADVLKNSPKSAHVWAIASLDDVKATMQKTSYRGSIRLIGGLVEKSIPQHCPDKIALLRLDTDWYESTYHELVHLYPRLYSGGILIIDDYGDWAGARKAVDQYIEENRLQIFLSRIDHTGRIAVKP